ncbi:hypothetical protein SeMB42_g06503 [Synchytrium endobioticum]|uniref:Uncharacterized protein n=1 Tax=Synchytrium endobioticum TaxID=286115 RepID=A0A507CCI5_9FUNG|nr:hypothetical protein SeLEV6574_g07919 [Synchytrium endobioticum]TPX39047.1 hypothetical protein SeMB42_g06503 [Synchytrium endobioticum]
MKTAYPLVFILTLVTLTAWAQALESQHGRLVRRGNDASRSLGNVNADMENGVDIYGHGRGVTDLCQSEEELGTPKLIMGSLFIFASATSVFLYAAQLISCCREDLSAVGLTALAVTGLLSPLLLVGFTLIFIAHIMSTRPKWGQKSAMGIHRSVVGARRRVSVPGSHRVPPCETFRDRGPSRLRNVVDASSGLDKRPLLESGSALRNDHTYLQETSHQGHFLGPIQHGDRPHAQ